MNKCSAALLGLCVSLAPALARADGPDSPGPDETVRVEPRSLRPGTVGLEAGGRVNVVPNAGLDPYASNDVVPQLSLTGSLVALRLGSLSVAARAGWDYGGTTAMTRGDAASLVVHRMTTGIELRYALAPWLHLVGDVSPGLLHLRGSIEEGGFDRPLVSRTWTWALDASGGLAFRMARFGRAEAPGAVWFMMEGGYGFAGKSSMALSPDTEPGDSRKFGPTVLPDLRLAGAMNRWAIGVTF